MTSNGAFRDDYISTSEISRRLGFSLTVAFIKNTLGVKPSFNIGGHGGSFWSPESASEVYAALIRHITQVARADAETMCPNCVTPWKCNGPHIPDAQARAVDTATEPGTLSETATSSDGSTTKQRGAREAGGP